ncbi:hypothetical protein ACTFIU_010418 [Dictyostelium citrinum]
MSSLKDFKFPESWNKRPNLNNQYIDQVYEDSSKVGVYQFNNKKHYTYFKNMVSVSSYFYPTYDREQMKLCGTFINWIFLIDDFLEDEENVTSEKQNDILQKIEHILLTGQYLNSNIEPTPTEKLTMFFYMATNEWAIKYNKIDIYNLTMTYILQWLHSVYPFNKTKESTKPIHMDLYSFIRKINVGVNETYLIGLLVDKEIHDIDISKIWFNPIFNRIMQNSSIHVGLFNDCASIQKETSHRVHELNPLYFIQKRENLSFDDTFKIIVEKCNESINQIIKDEQHLLKHLKEEGYTQNQLNQVNIILNYNHNIIQGNINWSLITKRYNNHDGKPFIFKKNRSNYI